MILVAIKKKVSMMFKIKWCQVAIYSLLFILNTMCTSVYCEVIFQDNFDDHSDWAPDQPIYPNTQANTSADGGVTGSTACTGCPDGAAKYRGYYIASSAWDGYKGNNTLNISSANARGGAGKALTFWMEPINTTKCDGGTKWCSDGQLSVSLPQAYNEIYIRFYIKFQPDWKWDSTNGSAAEKFCRATHLHELPGIAMYKFGTTGNHFPGLFFDLGEATYYGTEGILFKMHPRFQSSYHLGATPTPTYLINNDYAGYYVYGGTGTGGRKTFEEYIGDGNWHCFEIRLKGNSSVGAEDGEWEVWVDGTSIFTQTNVAWADSVYKSSYTNCINPPSDFVGWNWVSFGGNMLNRYYSEPTQIEQWYAIDDIVISTTYVGPLPAGPGKPHFE